MSTAPAQPATVAPTIRVAVDYAITGDLRYLSHHDELRMLTRALVRARWPLAYSQGYNPAPRITIPLPRSLGIACLSQLALVKLTGAPALTSLEAGLHAALPAGCTLRRVTLPETKLTPRATGVSYDLDIDGDQVGGLQERIHAVLAAATLVVRRDDGPDRPRRPIDIRPYLTNLDLDGVRLHIALAIDNQRTARPAEVLTVLELAPERYNHRVARGEIQWAWESARPAIGPAPHDERETLGEQTDQQEDHEDLT